MFTSLRREGLWSSSSVLACSLTQQHRAEQIADGGQSRRYIRDIRTSPVRVRVPAGYDSNKHPRTEQHQSISAGK